jgi:hypothetical protein
VTAPCARPAPSGCSHWSPQGRAEFFECLRGRAAGRRGEDDDPQAFAHAPGPGLASRNGVTKTGDVSTAHSPAGRQANSRLSRSTDCCSSRGDHYVLAMSRRASAHPERVDRQVDMSAPVEPRPRAHRGAHAAHQHPDVDRRDVGTDRPRAPGAFDQLRDDRDQLVLLGLGFRPRRPFTGRERVLNPGVPGGRLRDAAHQPRSARTVLRRPRGPRAPAR